MKPLIDGDEKGKVCRVCGNIKPLSDFHPNKSCSGGRVGTCKQCSNRRVRSWLNNTRETRRERINNRNKQVKQLVVDHFGNKCHDCGRNFPICVYDFHHLSDKDVNPSKALTWREDRMWEELKKCIMLCANCHRIRHFGDDS